MSKVTNTLYYLKLSASKYLAREVFNKSLNLIIFTSDSPLTLNKVWFLVKSVYNELVIKYGSFNINWRNKQIHFVT